MESWERVEYIIEKEGMNKNSFSEAVGFSSNVTITRLINEKRTASPNTCRRIVARFPQYSYEWLLNGEGDILSDTNSDQKISIGDNATTSGIIGSVGKIQGGVGNTMNLSLPSAGYVKIIKPDGTTEVRQEMSDEELQQTIEVLKMENSKLREVRDDLSDKLYKAQQDIISLLRDSK